MRRPFKALLLLTAVVALAGASCRPKIIEDPSAFAAAAGESTMVLGSDCLNPLKIGFTDCAIRHGKPVPELRLYFMNAADYAVSDCKLGILKRDSIAKPGEVVIDLSALNDQVQQAGFCLLRIEAYEYYPDPRDPSQRREIPLTGGYFIQVLDDGFFPDPPDSLTSWCFKVRGTNKGRRKLEKC